MRCVKQHLKRNKINQQGNKIFLSHRHTIASAFVVSASTDMNSVFASLTKKLKILSSMSVIYHPDFFAINI